MLGDLYFDDLFVQKLKYDFSYDGSGRWVEVLVCWAYQVSNLSSSENL